MKIQLEITKYLYHKLFSYDCYKFVIGAGEIWIGKEKTPSYLLNINASRNMIHDPNHEVGSFLKPLLENWKQYSEQKLVRTIFQESTLPIDWRQKEIHYTKELAEIHAKNLVSAGGGTLTINESDCDKNCLEWLDKHLVVTPVRIEKKTFRQIFGTILVLDDGTMIEFKFGNKKVPNGLEDKINKIIKDCEKDSKERDFV